MIFQEPMTSLNPVLTIGAQVTEAIRLHRRISGRDARGVAVGMLERVGIPDPVGRLGQYPHEFSGGMRQRVMIAIALACEPRVLIADEPTTALDVTIQAAILELIREIVERERLSVLLITHDLALMSEFADRIAVMYRGHLLEVGSRDAVLGNPRHPYTRGLLATAPDIGGTLRRLATLGTFLNGEPPGSVRTVDGERLPWTPGTGAEMTGEQGHELAMICDDHAVRVCEG